MDTIITESIIGGSITTAIATSLNFEPLITALIGFGVSVVTVVGAEFIKLLVAFLKNKRSKYEDINEEKEEK